MSTSTIRLNEGVREETTRIASEMGLTFNAVMNIMARKFNAEKGFPFPVRLETAKKTVFDMNSDEFEAACQAAVAQREEVITMDYVTRLDQDTGMITKVYADGRVEYVLD
ncbi:MAG: type II toxin-antitoxin system RelB/DinJ family antitoxin [Lachnospiraceae bacterium]|nr:type II toxin-antitoxin system RelB/DinJ family antitoxin [Lachnospiraceae bacterium]